MSEEIKVSVNSLGAGPVSGPVLDRPHYRQTENAVRKDEGLAARPSGWPAKLEKELEAGQVSPSRITWDEFVAPYDDEKLATLAPKTRETALASLRHVKRVLEHRISRQAVTVGNEQVCGRVSQRRDEGHHPGPPSPPYQGGDTLGGQARADEQGPGDRNAEAGQRQSGPFPRDHHGGIRAGRCWRSPKPGRMTRPVGTLHHRAMAVRSPAIRGPGPYVGPGRRFPCSPWEKRPVFIIRADGQKSGLAETCPMAPDFAAWLLTIPEAERTGRVFHLIDTRTNQPFGANRVGLIVEGIGRRPTSGWGPGRSEARTARSWTVPVFAGCHSYRRGFGSKWARRVAPSVLKRLMRHANIATTESYYVHLDASDVADELWAKFAIPAPADNPVLQQPCNNPPVESMGR